MGSLKPMIRYPRSAALKCLLLASALAVAGCQEYDGVPLASIEGAQNGLLEDAKAPFVVVFDKPVAPRSVSVKVVRATLYEEGDLGDEDSQAKTDLDLLFAYDAARPADVLGGTAELTEGGTRLVIQPDMPFPIAEKLFLLIEPGLSDTSGHEYVVRERISFSYDAKLTCAPSAIFKSGAYFFLADVTAPIGVQVQLFGQIEVNPETGEFVGAFVSADRNRDLKRCEAVGLSCDASQACRTVPEQDKACVALSEKAVTVDEYKDYVTNYVPPTGFDFMVKGCVDGSGAKTLFVNVPFAIKVQSPPVSLTETSLTGSFEKDAKGVVRGAGSIGAEHVFIGTTDSGKAEGSMTARSIPAGEEPKDLKKPDPPQ
jgi:hypothetical protein